MAHRRWVMGALCAWATVCATARADEPSPVTNQVEGYVVEVQQGDLVLDVGVSARLVVGQQADHADQPLKRPQLPSLVSHLKNLLKVTLMAMHRQTTHVLRYLCPNVR